MSIGSRFPTHPHSVSISCSFFTLHHVRPKQLAHKRRRNPLISKLTGSVPRFRRGSRPSCGERPAFLAEGTRKGRRRRPWPDSSLLLLNYRRFVLSFSRIFCYRRFSFLRRFITVRLSFVTPSSCGCYSCYCCSCFQMRRDERESSPA